MIKSNRMFAFAFVLVGLVANASIVDVPALNKKLKQENQRWRAKETWVNQLSSKELKRMVGALHVQNDVQFYGNEMEVADFGMPNVVDWRNKNGKNWVSPMLNQGGCGSCVSFAAVATIETQMNISSLLPGLNRRLSTQHLFSCGGGACERGWYPQVAADYIKNNGLVDEACMPYMSGATGSDMQCSQACPDRQARTWRISDYKKVTSWFNNLKAIKKALQNGPLMTTMMVYEDFMTYGSGVYKSTSVRRLGGHAVSIIGYDDTKNAYIIRNSWGETWGENGYAYIDYKDKSGIGDDAWSFAIPAMNSVVSMESPRDRDYLTGDIEFRSSNNINSAKQVRYTTIRPDASVVSSFVASGSSAAVFQSDSLADGKYQVVAEALDSHGNTLATSTYHYFYAVNTTPKLSVELSPAEKLDLSKPVKDRIEFDIITKSSSVPMNKLALHIVDSNNKEILRTTDTVLETMRTGWNTTAVPNGTYEVWVSGHLKTNAMDVKVESQRYSVVVKNGAVKLK